MRRARWIPVLGVLLNLAVLGCSNTPISSAAPSRAARRSFHPWHLILPLGISFFVFQKISYLIDLRRGDRHIYGFLDFCMFVTFFPQAHRRPAGAPQRDHRPVRAAAPRRPQMWENLSRGFVLFVMSMARR